jgi:hypothetical protein
MNETIKEEYIEPEINKAAAALRYCYNIVKLYDLKKFPTNTKGNVETGYALQLNKCENLMVIDFDINKSYDAERKGKVRLDILSKIPNDVFTVKTGSGGLHLYCNVNNYQLESNRMVKCLTCPDYDLDLLSGIEPSKTSLVVGVGSKSDKGRYDLTRGAKQSPIKYSCKELLDMLDIHIKVQVKKIGKKLPVCKPVNVSQSQKEIIIKGFQGLSVHNYAAKIQDEITLFTLFQGLNALGATNDEYEWIRSNCNLTEKASSNFDRQKDNLESKSSHVGVLVGMIKIHNSVYYEEHEEEFQNIFRQK